MPRVIRFLPLVSLSLACLAAHAAVASADQNLPALRVRKETATVHTGPMGSSPIVTTTTRGTVLESIDRQDDWYWVILPRDVHGTRIPGWVHASDLEVVGEGEAGAASNSFTEAIEAAKQREIDEAAREQERKEQLEARQRARDERKEARERARDEQKAARAKEKETQEQAREDALLARARQRLEQARREYEAAQKASDQPADQSAQPAADQPAAPAQPANPKASKRQSKK